MRTTTATLQTAGYLILFVLLALASGCDASDPGQTGGRVMVTDVPPDTFRFALRDELYPLVVADFFDVPDEYASGMLYDTSARDFRVFGASNGGGRGDTTYIQTFKADTTEIRFIAMTGCFEAADMSFGRPLIVYESTPAPTL